MAKSPDAKAAPERRTPAELRTLYVVEPDVRDIVVEGRTDRRLISWYLREHGRSNAKVYAVDDRVNPLELPKLVPEPGKRDYVLALAQEVGAQQGEHPGLTCVVDSDRDGFGSVSGSAHLIRTDFGSMDVYAFQERPLQQMLDVGLGRDISAAVLIDHITPVLVDLAVVRRALHDVGVPVVDHFERTFKRRIDGGGRVDRHELIRRSLNARRLTAELDAAIERVEYFTTLVPSDPRLVIRGHDIAPVLAWHQDLRGVHAKRETLEGMMRTSLTTADLDDHLLFRRILQRVAS